MNNLKLPLLLIILLPLVCHPQTAVITGKLTEYNNNQQIPLPFANVFLEGTTYGTTTDFEGNFRFAVPCNRYNLICSYMGYQTIKKLVELNPGKEVNIEIAMKPEGIAIESVSVIAKANRESNITLMTEQKNASVAIETVGAKELSANGSGNAAAGITKMAGITKQSGSYTINVRGLGDRYNTTTLNGLPLPGNHAEFKNFNLELLPTDIIEHIAVEKVFSPKLFGDVAGANINIATKHHTGKKFIEFEISTGSNTNLNKATNFYLQQGADFWGFNYIQRPDGEYAPTNYNMFKHSWTPQNVDKLPNIGFGLKAGCEFKLKNNSTIGIFGAAGFDNNFNYNSHIENRVNGSGIYRQKLNGENYSYNTQTNAMLNVSYTRPSLLISYNSILMNSSEQELTQLNGFIIDIVSDEQKELAYLRRSEFNRNLVFINQLLGNYKFKNNSHINWGFAVNNVLNTLPDRMNNIFVQNKQTGIYVASTNNHRYWHNLTETEYAANISYQKGFGQLSNDNFTERLIFTLGFNSRLKTRNFESLQYNHRINSDNYNDTIDIWDVDKYFSNERLQSGVFSLRTLYGNLNIPVTYNGTQIINALAINADYNITDKLLLVAGLRTENVIQNIIYKTTISKGENGFNKYYLLPSVSARYKLNSKNNLRFSVSQTYTLPQFKETAPFQFEGITFSSVGNPYLYPSINYNTDLKWEFFPDNGQLLSVTTFGKYIKNPINHFVMSSASNDYTYANTGDWAYVYGAELDLRKSIFAHNNNDNNQQLFIVTNLSVMQSKQILSNQKVSNESEGKYISSFNTQYEQLQGAAPIIANAGLQYTLVNTSTNKRFFASLVYNYTADRLYLLGYAGAIGNQVDKALNRVDLILKADINKVELSVTAKNLLNTAQKRVQTNAGTEHVLLLYRDGIAFKLGVKYKF